MVRTLSGVYATRDKVNGYDPPRGDIDPMQPFMTFEEIAKRFGVDRETVRKDHNRAIAKLRLALKG